MIDRIVKPHEAYLNAESLKPLRYHKSDQSTSTMTDQVDTFIRILFQGVQNLLHSKICDRLCLPSRAPMPWI